jgi:hypothetical protein
MIRFRIGCGPTQKRADAPKPLGLLRPRRQRPRHRGAADERYELAPRHSIVLASLP